MLSVSINGIISLIFGVTLTVLLISPDDDRIDYRQRSVVDHAGCLIEQDSHLLSGKLAVPALVFWAQTSV